MVRGSSSPATSADGGGGRGVERLDAAVSAVSVDKCGDLVGGNGACEQPTLAGVASRVSQFVKLAGFLDAFGDDTELEIMPDADDRPDHGAALFGTGLIDLVDEAAVDLEEVDGEGTQVRQRRVSGAEIVDRELDSETFEGFESFVNVGGCLLYTSDAADE